MADGERGGVGVRLFVHGAEVVRRTFDQVGDDGRRMWAKMGVGADQVTPGLRLVNSTAREVRGGIDDMAASAGPAGRLLSSLGVTGLVAAAALGALTLAATAAFGQARQAMDFADQLDDASRRIHINVEALQEWRFVADEFGASAADADRALEGFMRKFGEAQSGLSPRAMRPFAALGFTPEQLRSFRSGEEALEAVIDKIAGLGDAAEQAAVAERLGLGPLLPVIREGGDAIARVREEARQLGVVMDREMVERTAQSQRQFEILSQVIDVQLKSAFVDLAPVLVMLMGLVADLARALGDLADQWRALEDRTDRGLDRRAAELTRQQARLYGRGLDSDLNPRGSIAGMPLRFDDAGRVIDNAADYSASIDRELADIQFLREGRAARSGTPPLTGAGELDVPASGGRDNSAAEARKAEMRQRALEDLAAELDLLDARAARDVERIRTLERERDERQFLRRLQDQEVSVSEQQVLLERRRAALAAQRAEEIARLTQEIGSGLTAEVARLDEAFGVLEDSERGDELRRRIRAYEQIMGLEEAILQAKLDQQVVDEARQRAAERWMDQQAEALDLELARLAGDEATVRVLERQNWERERSLQLQREGKLLPRDADDQARREAEDREIARRRGQMRAFARDFVDGVTSGDLRGFFDNLADRFVDRLNDRLADDLMRLFDMLADRFSTRMGASGGGGGGIFSLVSSVLGAFGGGGGGGLPATGFSGANVLPGLGRSWNGAGLGAPGLDLPSLGKGGGLGAAGMMGAPSFAFTYAPQYNVKGGTSDDIARLREEMERDRREFQGRVITTVKEANAATFGEIFDAG